MDLISNNATFLVYMTVETRSSVVLRMINNQLTNK